jgi:hypothetical protein
MPLRFNGRGGDLKKTILHVLGVLACGTTATLLVAWSAPSYREELYLRTYEIGAPAVAAKLNAGDAGWAKLLAVDNAQGQAQTYYACRVDRPSGLFSAEVCRCPVTKTAAQKLLDEGAVRGTSRADSLGGEPPDSLVRRAQTGGGADETIFVVYWGWYIPLVRCDIVVTPLGNVGSTAGLTATPLGHIRPYAPVWPGFAYGVLLLGAVGWAALYGTYYFAARIAIRKFKAARDRYRPPLPPTVACAGCGYPRKGLPSIEPCPECGHRLVVKPPAHG